MWSGRIRCGCRAVWPKCACVQGMAEGVHGTQALDEGSLRAGDDAHTMSRRWPRRPGASWFGEEAASSG